MKTTTLGALALAGAMACGATPTATVDFTAPTGPINKWLHCSGYGARVLSAHVLDHTRDLEPVAVEWKDGTLSLPRKDDNSAAFFVVFER